MTSSFGYWLIIGSMLLLILVLCSCESEPLCPKKYDNGVFRCETKKEICEEHADECGK